MVYNRNGKGICLYCKLFDDVEKKGKLNVLVCIFSWMD